MSRHETARAKHDRIYQELKRRILANDYDGFWEVMHEHERKTNQRTLRFVGSFALILILVWYLEKYLSK